MYIYVSLCHNILIFYSHYLLTINFKYSKITSLREATVTRWYAASALLVRGQLTLIHTRSCHNFNNFVLRIILYHLLINNYAIISPIHCRQNAIFCNMYKLFANCIFQVIILYYQRMSSLVMYWFYFRSIK